MKELKILHINFVEEYTWAASYLQTYLEQGFELKCLIPDVVPASNESCFSFYKAGLSQSLSAEVA